MIDPGPMQRHEVIDGHHRTMVQFRTPRDSGYRKVVSALKYYTTMLGTQHDNERMCKDNLNPLPIIGFID
jgi:hypothetical protein